MTKLRYLIPLLLAAAVSAQAAERDDLDSRVQRLERLLESQSLMEMLTRLDRQQQELAKLRGALEETRHELESLRQRQRDLYLDTDRRLSRIERESIPGPAPVETAPPGAAPANSESGGEQQPPSEAGATTTELVAERKAYQEAFDVLRELRYEQAIEAFEGFLEQYPEGRYAHIAQYWLGEANYARRDFEQAIDAYRALVKHHDGSPKVAEALLKIGYSYHELGKDGKARPFLEQLMEEYPDTTEAGQAQSLLKQLDAAEG